VNSLIKLSYGKSRRREGGRDEREREREGWRENKNRNREDKGKRE
jgi:hypothetical protein